MNRRFLSPGQRVAAALLVAVLVACDSPTKVVPVSSVVVEAPTTMLDVGASAQLTVRVLDASGNALQGRAVDWSSSNDAVIAVDAAGSVQAHASGTASITARVEGRTGRVVLTARARVAQVTVSPSEFTLEQGLPQQLTATLRDADGGVIGGRTVEWSSSDDAVATVDSAGRVLGVAVGEARITASSDGQSATAQVWVVGGPDPFVVPALSVGEVFAVPAHERRLQVGGGAAGGAYALVPFLSTTTPRTAGLRITSGGVQTAAAAPAVAPAMSLQRRVDRHGHHQPRADEWERRLREREVRELSPLVRGGGARAPAGPEASLSIAPAAVPSVGELIRLNVESDDNPCELDRADFRWGRVVAVTQRAIVVADTANPSGPGTFSDAEYLAFGERFDQLVWPTSVANFGEPADIDGNDRVIIFFTRAVNELTPAGQNWYVGGFFHARDLFPRTPQPGFGACPASNQAEMFYMLVPDPQGEVNGNERTKEDELRGTVGTIAHELQHLINASRRLYVVGAPACCWFEEIWLNEGLSHIAEELMLYASSSLEPRQNIDGDRIVGEQHAFFDYQIANVSRLATYLENPDTTSLLGPDDALSTRGAVWSFLRYAADRRGGSESAFWRSLVDNDVTGVSNLAQALGAPPTTWISDWSVALYADDLVPDVDPRFTMPSWNMRSIYPRFVDGSGNPVWPDYPLRTRTLGAGGDLTLSVRSGSAAYLLFGVAAAGTADLTVAAPGGGPPDEAVRLMLIRTQ